MEYSVSTMHYRGTTLKLERLIDLGFDDVHSSDLGDLSELSDFDPDTPESNNYINAARERRKQRKAQALAEYYMEVSRILTAHGFSPPNYFSILGLEV